MAQIRTYQPRRTPLLAIVIPSVVFGVLVTNALWLHDTLPKLLPLLIGSGFGVAIAILMPVKRYAISVGRQTVEGPVRHGLLLCREQVDIDVIDLSRSQCGGVWRSNFLMLADGRQLPIISWMFTPSDSVHIVQDIRKAQQKFREHRSQARESTN